MPLSLTRIRSLLLLTLIAVCGSAPALAAPPINGGPDAHRDGVFGPLFAWPLNAIHAALLPDGRVMTFGTDGDGTQGASMIYDLWDPTKGTTAASHTTVGNNTQTDFFCCAMLLIPKNGKLILTGGDITRNGRRNFSTADVNIFNPRRNLFGTTVPMRRPRWYPTLTTLPDARVLVHGGRERRDLQDPKAGGNLTPEVYTAERSFQDELTGATSEAAYGTDWYYPHTFVTPKGRVWFATEAGRHFILDTDGTGAIKELPRITETRFEAAAAFAWNQGRAVITGGHAGGFATDRTWNVNLWKQEPEVTPGPTLNQPRTEHDATILADGSVLISGGSARWNRLDGVGDQAELWEPRTKAFRPVARAGQPRLYHSTALLLPDATVLTAGGGSPGPVTQLNGELYYPPYLFKKDGSGELADRPELRWAEAIRYNRDSQIGVRHGKPIREVRLVKTGAVTHANNMDQRTIRLEFSQSDTVITARGPYNSAWATPGYWMLFLIDSDGVPSVARIIKLI